MRVITEPKVFLVGRQEVVQSELDSFLNDHGVTWESDSDVGAEVLSEVAGRVCYMSFAKPRPGGNSAYLHHIKEVGHGSVLEHAVFNLIITDVSRSLTHELVRHRAGFGYSQLSQRYVDESVAEYVIPEDLKDEVAMALLYREHRDAFGAVVLTNAEAFAFMAAEQEAIRLIVGPEAGINQGTVIRMAQAGLDWLVAVETAHAKYGQLVEYLFQKIGTKIADNKGTVKTPGGPLYVEVNLTQGEKTEVRKRSRQAARSVLPNATETKIFVTANARALRHFLVMRGALAADLEIRALAVKMWRVLTKEAPNLFNDIVLVSDDRGAGHGSPYLTTSFPKV